MKHYIHCHMGFDTNKGGTVGYLSSLLQGFESSPELFYDGNIQYGFMFPDIKPADRLPMQVDPSLIANTAFPEVYTYLADREDKHIQERRNWFHSTLPIPEIYKVNLHQITSVHIHGVYNFIPFYNFLRSCGIEKDVVKILTTHNPWKPEFEDVEILTGRFRQAEQLEEIRFFLQRRDEHSFRLADALLFPSEHSLEGYYEYWPEFASIVKGKKIYFSATGAKKLPVTYSRETMRKELNIPEDAIVFAYIGRFLKIHGYDLYIEAAKRILEQHPSKVYFLAIGQKNKSLAIEHPHWMEIPFVTDIGNYIHMIDGMVVANRGSLFDLSMIECLSIGTPIIAAKVGGYKYLEGKTSGVTYFEGESVDRLVDALMHFMNLSKVNRDSMCKDNMDLYNRELTEHEFARGYTNTIARLYKDFEITPPNRDSIHVPYWQGIDTKRTMLDLSGVKKPPEKKPVSKRQNKNHLQEAAVQVGQNHDATIRLYLEYLFRYQEDVRARRELAEVYIKAGNRMAALQQLRISRAYEPKNKNLIMRYLKIKYPKLMYLFPNKIFK